MKILFTGASSFTGYWFAKELASAGHQVFALFRHQPRDYPDDLRRQRVKALNEICQSVFGIFGDERVFAIDQGMPTGICSATMQLRPPIIKVLTLTSPQPLKVIRGSCR